MSKSRSLTNRHLVLDLDSTLIHSSVEMDVYENMHLYSDTRSIPLRSRLYRFDLVDAMDVVPGTGSVMPMWGVFRPHVFEFLQFASVYFEKVHIWSAGQYKYVHNIKAVLFPKPDFQPDVVLTHDDCEMSSTMVCKPLSKLYGMGVGANETNTLALDDRDDTFSKNPYNGIQIEPYEPGESKEEIMDDDDTLQKLMCWLSLPEVMRESDVRYLDKRYIFDTPLSTYHKRLKEIAASGV